MTIEAVLDKMLDEKVAVLERRIAEWLAFAVITKQSDFSDFPLGKDAFTRIFKPPSGNGRTLQDSILIAREELRKAVLARALEPGFLMTSLQRDTLRAELDEGAENLLRREALRLLMDEQTTRTIKRSKLRGNSIDDTLREGLVYVGH